MPLLDVSNSRVRVGNTLVKRTYLGSEIQSLIPSELFVNGEQGVWYDPSDLSTLFQDSAGTLPVTGVEQPVGLMLDKSGRGNHAVQATTTARPVLRADEQGLHYLSFDGVDDYMTTLSALPPANDVTVIVGAKKGSNNRGMVVCGSGDAVATSNAYSIELPSATSTTLLCRARGTGTGRAAYGDVPANHLGVVSAELSVATSRLQLRNNGALFATSTASLGAGPITSGKLSIGGTPTGAVLFNGAFYGALVSHNILGSAQLNVITQYMRNKTKAY